MKSAITVSLVEEARGGPFVYWSDLEQAFRSASELGFDGIEIFAPGPDQYPAASIKELVRRYSLPVAAVGTGAGMVKHGLTLTAESPEIRQRAFEFVRSMMEFGARLSAPAIIGSMQGRWTPNLNRDAALKILAEQLHRLGEIATQLGTQLFFEPINRYETNLIRNMGEGRQLLESVECENVKLLADLFHLNIEEKQIAPSLKSAGKWLGHVHFVDSNRQAVGFGHIEFGPIIRALRETGYEGYLSAEALPLPDSDTAATQTIQVFRELTSI